MNFLKKFVIFLLLASLIGCLFACNDNNDDENLTKEAFLTAVSNTENASIKAVDSKYDIKFIFYEANGTPCTVHERITLNRINDGQSLYLDGTVKTIELGSFISDTLNSFSGLMGELTAEPAFIAMINFMTGIDYVAFRASVHEQSANLQLERVAAAEQPVYNFSDDGKEFLDLKSGWFGASYSEFQTFQAESEYKVLREFDLFDTAMMLSLIPLDWTKAVDSADAQKVDYNGVQANQYRLAVNKDVIIPFVRSTIEQGMSELFGIDKEFYDEINGYYNRHADRVTSMFTVPDHTVVAYTDENNRLIHTESNWDLKFSININDMAEIMRAEGAKEEDITSLTSVLSVANTMFIGSSNQLKGQFEFGIKLTVTENYSYENVIIDKTSSIFTPYDADIPGRYTVGIVVDEENGGHKYVETNVPSAVAEYQAQKKAEEEAKRAEEEAKKNEEQQEGGGTTTSP